jgi:hypothetical protein
MRTSWIRETVAIYAGHTALSPSKYDPELYSRKVGGQNLLLSPVLRRFTRPQLRYSDCPPRDIMNSDDKEAVDMMHWRDFAERIDHPALWLELENCPVGSNETFPRTSED